MSQASSEVRPKKQPSAVSPPPPRLVPVRSNTIRSSSLRSHPTLARIDELRIPVRFTYAGPSECVELMGDFPSWKRSIRLTRDPNGVLGTTLELEPGIYRYKFRVDGRSWVLDPSAPVDCAEGYENSVAIVGGSRPPLFFAPDRRHVMRRTDGVIRVHAELETIVSAPRSVWVRMSDGQKFFGFVHQTGQRAGRRMLTAEIRTSPEHARLPGVLGFLGLPEQMFPLPPCCPQASGPNWIEGSTFYGIFIDRWLRGEGSLEDRRVAPRDAPSTSSTLYGGDLDGIREGLAHIASLGVDAVVLTPVSRSDSPHRYDAHDLQSIDERLGGEAALRRLIEAAHRWGLKVVLDAAFTHVHIEHAAFRDVLANQDRSRYVDWFRIHHFPVLAGQGGSYDHYYGKNWLPWLNFENAEVREHVIQSALKLVRLGADGLRLDAMDEVEPDFWPELRARVRGENPDVLLLGEVVIDDLAQFAEERGVDCATDFPHREAMKHFFAREDIDAAEFWSRAQLHQHRFGPFDPSFRLLFFDNHDVPRLLSLALHSSALELALVYLLTRPETVWLTYGTEIGLCAGAKEGQLDEVWLDRCPMPPLSDAGGPTVDLIRTLTELRRKSSALRASTTRLIHAEGRGLVFERGSLGAGERIWVFINAGDQPLLLGAPVDEAEVLLETGSSRSSIQPPFAPVPARTARVVRLREGK